MIGIENHLLGPLYTIPITVGPNWTIWAYFCTKCEGVSFLPSNGKNGTVFFKNRKLTSIWLRSIQYYRRWRSKSHSTFYRTYHDWLYAKLWKIFLCYLSYFQRAQGGAPRGPARCTSNFGQNFSQSYVIEYKWSNWCIYAWYYQSWLLNFGWLW